MKSTKKKLKSGAFQVMGLSPQILKAIQHRGYKIPTPIQRKSIPLILSGSDIVAMARTGSGKTAAFLIPLLEKLKCHAYGGARGLIMSPTRELAIQTYKFAKEFCKYIDIKLSLIIGGDSLEEQFEALHSNPDIIICTPGRLMHVSLEMNLNLNTVSHVIFDEADRLFEMGFKQQLHEILSKLSHRRQTLIFSATLPSVLIDFAEAGLHDPKLIRLDVENKLSKDLHTCFFYCRAEDKIAVLIHIMKNFIKPEEQTVVFAATKHHLDYLHFIFEKINIPVSVIHSSLDTTARKINVAKFHNKMSSVLLVTDLAARGLDIPMLHNAVNFNFPAKPKLFVHRVGRVARAGMSGTAYSLIEPEECSHLLDLFIFLGKPVKISTERSEKTDSDILGTVPQMIIDSYHEDIKVWLSQSEELRNLAKVSFNAHRKYTKTKPAASRESNKNAKHLIETIAHDCHAHPLFLNMNSVASKSERGSLLQTLHSHKPKSTIFEINSSSKKTASVVMMKKRLHDDSFVTRENAKRKKFGKTSHNQLLGTALNNSVEKDDEIFVPYTPKGLVIENELRVDNDFSKEAKNLELDILPDDEESLNAHSRSCRNALVWDEKKKKFVNKSSKFSKSNKFKSESGQWISSSFKTSKYKTWLEKKGDSLGDEYNSPSQTTDKKKVYRGRKKRNNRNRKSKRAMSSSDVSKTYKSGSSKDNFGRLKMREQIVKNREVKAKRAYLLKAKQSKHK